MKKKQEQKKKAQKKEQQNENPLTFDLLRVRNVERCEDVFHQLGRWDLAQWSNALAGEVGEACNITKKILRLEDADSEQDTPDVRKSLKEQLAMELADVIIYADLVAARAGINLAESVVLKFNIVSEVRDSEIML